jgi:pyruvate formate-lyase activating enzyme-like uncharacterized protein
MNNRTLRSTNKRASTSEIHKLPDNSVYIGELPKGCSFCGTGEKMVLLITGKCMKHCFYCPLSIKKRGKSVIYANELKVKSLDQIIGEAKAISAKGTGVTGGDPMFVPELTLEAIQLLKDSFGDKHHIHLYTSGGFDKKYIAALASVGLDELRLHPPMATWGRDNIQLEKIIQLALKHNISVGAELPMLPNRNDLMLRFVRYLDRCGAEFLNLNELEFSESNWQKLNKYGYKQKDSISSSVFGSERDALIIINELAKLDDLNLGVHYCSASFKDRQQLTNRLKRRAKNVIRPFELLTDDGTFLLGIVEAKAPESYGMNMKALEIEYNSLKKNYGIPDELINLDIKNKRIEIASWILKELQNDFSKTFKTRIFIIEEYPTADRLEVERIPIDEF